MPELPEAETIVRSLRPHVAGRRIVGARFLAPRVSRDEASVLVGRVVVDVARYGKQVLLVLDRGVVLVKLGMTGALLWNGDAGPYTRAVIETDGGTLLFDDVRQFGSLTLLGRAPESLGPDPLEIGAAEFAERMRGRDTELKRLLLDQSFVRGIGNIYADEALFDAGLSPRRRTRRVRVGEAAALHGAIQELLKLAIAHRGSSVSDYVDAAGERGGFQNLHRVYRKEGAPCPRCGTAIRRIVVAQRGTHYCPRCQR
jgi:formamidopyrimidine-DNA glycosylase